MSRQWAPASLEAADLLAGRVEAIKEHHAERMELLRQAGLALGPATVVALLSADFSGQGINLYDGSPTFFDADTAAPFKLKTLLTLNPTANLIFNQTVPFERARFTCTPGAAFTAASFPCTITSEVDIVSRTIPVDQRPACSVSLSAP